MRLLPYICWTVAVGYCFMVAMCIILQAYWAVGLCIGCIILAHHTLLKTENPHGLHGTPKDAHQ